MVSDAAQAHDRDLPLACKVAFLSRRDAYPDRPAGVEAIETHMSWVFLTDRHAYKLKKPVRRPFLDFSTIEARRRHCADEVRLNRRLAPAVYLGAVPLVSTAAGLRLGGPGEVVDWLVKMVRLPSERVLDRGIANGTVERRDAVAIGRVLAGFYRSLPPVRVDPAEYRRRFAADAEASLEAVTAAGGPARIARAGRIAAAQAAMLSRRAAEFDRRVRDGRIVEGHGDLRPEHVYLDGTPSIIDCLEFDYDLRTLDPADELGFLALECERLGAAWIGMEIFATYTTVTQDDPPRPLVDFYQSFRALQRARLAIWHVAEPGRHPPQEWLRRADLYLELGESYAARLAAA